MNVENCDSINLVIGGGDFVPAVAAAAILIQLSDQAKLVSAEVGEYSHLDPDSWEPERTVLFIDYCVMRANKKRVPVIAEFADRIVAAGHQLIWYRPPVVRVESHPERSSQHRQGFNGLASVIAQCMTVEKREDQAYVSVFCSIFGINDSSALQAVIAADNLLTGRQMDRERVPPALIELAEDYPTDIFFPEEAFSEEAFGKCVGEIVKLYTEF